MKPLKLNNNKIKQRILADIAVHINEYLQEFLILLVL